MGKGIVDALKRMRDQPQKVRFSDLKAVCDHYFGEPRTVGSHVVYKMPWPGDPRVNFQRGRDNYAKPYQVNQVLKAVERKGNSGKGV
nr:hypothetical protein [Corynebacterium oculi]